MKTIQRLKNEINAHISPQIIKKDGKPAFAVIPYDEYLEIISNYYESGEKVVIPHEVAGLVIKKNMNLIKAWRTHLGLSQKHVAKAAGISQSALSQMEKTENNPQSKTLEKLAAAMHLSIAQLTD